MAALERTPRTAGGVPPLTFDSVRLMVSVGSATVSFTIVTGTLTLRTPGAKVTVEFTGR